MDDCTRNRFLFLWTLLPIVSSQNWKTGEWGSCVSATCGEGRRQRSVWCSDLDGFKTSEGNCEARTKPISKEDCFKVCHQLESYLWWDIGDWSECRPLRGATEKACRNTVGVSKRNVTCKYQAPWAKTRRDSSSINLISKSTKIRRVPDSACAHFWDKPVTEITCSYECPRDCVILKLQRTKTSSWVSTVIRPPSNGGKPCPRLRVRSARCERDALACPPSKLRLLRHANVTSFVLSVGPWGECRRDDGNAADYGARPPGKDAYLQVTVVGIQKRNITCKSNSGKIAKLRDCLGGEEEAPISSRACLISVDCGLSPWSEWRVVREGCSTSGGEIHPEIKERTRDVLRFPVGNGKPCSLTRERKILLTATPCRQKFKWLPLAWSTCTVKGPPDDQLSKSIQSDGEGHKTRRIICVRTKDLTPVEDDLCYEDKPTMVEDCFVERDRDCVLSSWSAWSHCIPVKFRDKLLPPKESYTKRTRRVITPATGKGVCGEPLQQADDCDNGVYDWKYGEWGPCRADDNKQFGPGIRSRKSRCLLYDNSEISSAFCELYSILDDVEECYSPRSHDCVLSEWSRWATCSMPCAVKNVFGQTTRKRTVLAFNGSRSNYTCDNEDLEQTDVCNEWFCDGYAWKAGNWQECHLPDGQICGTGVQRRVVWCVKKGLSVKKSSCSMLPELSKERACEVGCPVDCQLTPFSEYTECPEICDLGARKERERFVISEARNGGKSCPLILKESRACYETTDDVCRTKAQNYYSWFSGSWSSCRPLDTVRGCGEGRQSRDVSCRNSANGSSVEPWLCGRRNNSGFIFADLGDDFNSRPKGFRPCFVNCSSGCVETPWLPTTSCQQTCQDLVLSKQFLGSINSSANEKKCLKNEESRLVRQCSPPENLNASFSNWSDCITHSECGEGYKYKRGHRVNETTCQQIGIVEERCAVECPVDCVMSEWSNWPACTTLHSPGYVARKRTVLREPNASGRKCPNNLRNGDKEEEFFVSRYCDRYSLIADPYWSQCHARDKTNNCGPGIQTRKNRCFLIVDEKPTELVSNEFCAGIKSPLINRNCTLPCPGDCLVSEWSDWTPCQRPCDSSQNQNRSRIILRPSDSENPNSVQQCPGLNETRGCVLGESCYQYEWVLGDWSSCVLPRGNRCGFGTKERALLCRRHDGVGVDAGHCQYLSAIKKSQLVDNCSVECVRHCQTSQWSQWNDSQCRSPDTNGFYERHRRVIALPSERGRPCGALKQSRPCPYEARYHWSMSSWSECDLGVNISDVCGTGTRKRKIECFRSDGVKVENINCLLVNLSAEIKAQRWLDQEWLTDIAQARDEEECSVACPADCVLTPWSEWGDCHRECFTGDTLGWRSRSRAVLVQPSEGGADCPDDLYQSLPCYSATCLSYEWFARGNRVECRRSDGLLVKGGFSASESNPCVTACLSLGAQIDSIADECRCPLGSRFQTVTLPNHGYEGNSPNTNRGTNPNEPDIEWTSLAPCRPIKMGLDVSKNISDGPNVRFLPEDDEASFWMYAMISVGTAFVIFVIATVYLMCHSSLRERVLKMQRRRNSRRRSMDANDPCSDTMLSYHSGTKTT